MERDSKEERTREGQEERWREGESVKEGTGERGEIGKRGRRGRGGNGKEHEEGEGNVQQEMFQLLVDCAGDLGMARRKRHDEKFRAR